MAKIAKFNPRQLNLFFDCVKLNPRQINLFFHCVKLNPNLFWFILKCNDPKIKGSLNEMKFGTQINLVIYTEYDGAIYFKFEDTCHLLSPIWSRKFTENVLVAPN